MIRHDPRWKRGALPIELHSQKSLERLGLPSLLRHRLCKLFRRHPVVTITQLLKFSVISVPFWSKSTALVIHHATILSSCRVFGPCYFKLVSFKLLVASQIFRRIIDTLHATFQHQIDDLLCCCHTLTTIWSPVREFNPASRFCRPVSSSALSRDILKWGARRGTIPLRRLHRPECSHHTPRTIH